MCVRVLGLGEVVGWGWVGGSDGGEGGVGECVVVEGGGWGWCGWGRRGGCKEGGLDGLEGWWWCVCVGVGGRGKARARARALAQLCGGCCHHIGAAAAAAAVPLQSYKNK